MEPLGDVDHVQSRFGQFGHNVDLSASFERRLLQKVP